MNNWSFLINYWLWIIDNQLLTIHNNWWRSTQYKETRLIFGLRFYRMKLFHIPPMWVTVWQTNKQIFCHCDNEAVFNVVQFPENRILWGSFRKTCTNVWHYPIVQIVQSQGVTGYTLLEYITVYYTAFIGEVK